MSGSTVIMALLMGFTGSLHCAGMCGPIMMVMPFQLFTGARKALAIILYHLGRVTSYAAMATVFYSFRSLFEPRVQQYISMALGALLLIIGLASFLSAKFVALPWTNAVKNRLMYVMGQQHLGAITAAGILNGLLPCGLVYMALSATVTLPSATDAVLFMYVFGAGTMPMLVSLTLLRSRIRIFQGPALKKLVPLTMFFFGCIFFLRGLNLGIPYLSPKVVVSSDHQVHSCCHKKR